MDKIRQEIENIKIYIGTLENKIADLYSIVDDLQNQINDSNGNNLANM